MIQPILIWPDPTLKEKSTAVDPKDDVAQVIENLLDTMYATSAVGLSAIQLGVPLRIFVMDIEGTEDLVFINPQILGYDGKKELTNEGCMSLPGIVEQVERYPKVAVRFLDRNFVQHDQGFAGMEAQCVQHEVEHLDGILIPDHFSKERQELIRLKLKHRQNREKP